MSGRGHAGGGSHPRWPSSLVGVALVAATLAAYRPVLENDFVEYDDVAQVVGVPEVAAGLSPGGVAWALTSLDHANWYPMTRLSWMLDVELFGMDPAAFHATSLAFHVLSALLLLLAFTRLTGALWPSAFVAFVFALHPLHVESVAWVSARKDVVSGLFFVLALLAHERRARGRRPRTWSAVLAGLLALGLMAKPMLVTLPFVLLLLDIWPLRRWQPGAPRTDAWALVREKGLLFGLVLISCVATIVAQQQVMASGAMLPLPVRLLNAGLATFDYVERAFWPVDLAVLYPMPQYVGSNRVVLAFGVLAIASVFAWRRLPWRPWYFVGWFWFLGMLVPVIGIVQVGIQASADRYSYLPLIGLSVVAAWGVRDMIATLPGAARRAVVPGVAAAAAVACLALAATTQRQIATWRDGRTLFEHAIAVTGDNPWAHHYLGLLLQAQGKLDAALRQHERALELEPEEKRFQRALERARAETAPR